MGAGTLGFLAALLAGLVLLAAGSWCRRSGRLRAGTAESRIEQHALQLVRGDRRLVEKRLGEARALLHDRGITTPSHGQLLGAWQLVYGRWFDGFRERLVARARRSTEDRSEAEEIVQQALSELTRKRPPVESYEGLAFTIVHRRAADWTRRRGRRPPEQDLDVTASLSDGTQLAAPQRDPGASMDVEILLATLSVEHRRVILLRDVLGASFAEIGDDMGRSEQAAKQLYYYARKLLRARAASVEEGER